MEKALKEKGEELALKGELNKSFDSATNAVQKLTEPSENTDEKIVIKKKRRRVTKNKEEKIDINMIKKPLSPYILFCKEVELFRKQDK